MTDTPKSRAYNYTEILLGILILLMCFLNLEKFPVIGDNATAIKYVKKACNAKNVTDRLTLSSKASELNSYWSDFATALSTQAALAQSNDYVKAYYSPENPTYIQATNAYNTAYFKVIQVCSNHTK
jgi:hypothetical protein